MADNPDISVIIPVYGVEAFAERCARSLMEQTLGEGVEFIFVDDCSTDRSMDIIRSVIAEYPARHDQVKILRHDRNRGLPSARNTGLSAASGEYILHVDSDDFLDPDMLRLMLEKARETDADVVWSDWYLSFEKSERLMTTPSYDSAREALQGVLSGRMKYNVWNKLVRRELYTANHITFPDGYGMGEDMTMIMVMAGARKVARVDRPLYHYRRLNQNAFTADRAKRSRSIQSLRHNAERVVRFLSSTGVPSEWIDIFKLSSKFPLLISDRREDFRLWREMFPEANRAIDRSGMAWRNRLLQKMAARGWRWPLWLYYKLIIKTLYGIIYR